MRPSVCLLMVILALSCYEANARICPVFTSEITSFLFAEENAFRLRLDKYRAPPEAVAAKLEVKKCTDQIPLWKRLELEKILGAPQRPHSPQHCGLLLPLPLRPEPQKPASGCQQATFMHTLHSHFRSMMEPDPLSPLHCLFSP
ncbi:secretoglobin family 1D member 4 [Eulemur rufifrons]|uniref:secretoglobin family 1D member 4 n=1 Tax=Eulemur rufifrons TaxID=859984 RepID=UPI00374421DD